MKIKATPLPLDKPFLSVLLNLGDRTKSSWIYFDESVLNKLLAETLYLPYNGEVKRGSLCWKSNSEFPNARIVISAEHNTAWVEITNISGVEGLNFNYPAVKPKEIFFFTIKKDE
jgi:hypothetical protein